VSEEDSENAPSLLQFPCDIPVKLMGRDSPAFHSVARSLVEQHTGPLAHEKISAAVSRNGQFVSITIVVDAQSQQQLDSIYRDATAHADVLMAL
jgi:putative lipoic acid-binding regulatory protein